MTPMTRLSRFLVLPQLEIKDIRSERGYALLFELRSTTKDAVCRRCPTLCKSVYDHRQVRIKDAPLRNGLVLLVVWKKRYWCPNCKKPFTEILPGIKQHSRHTERFKDAVYQACEKFMSLKQVVKTFRCSSDLVYKIFYEALRRKEKERQSPWPKVIGLDEHSFRRASHMQTAVVTQRKICITNSFQNKQKV